MSQLLHFPAFSSPKTKTKAQEQLLNASQKGTLADKLRVSRFFQVDDFRETSSRVGPCRSGVLSPGHHGAGSRLSLSVAALWETSRASNLRC